MDNAPAPRVRRPTLADVAAAAGVSVPLVSIVMRDVPGASAATRRRVRRWPPTSAIAPISGPDCCGSSGSRLLGVTFEVEQAFHGDLVEGIYAAAEPAGYDVVLSAIAPARPEARAIDALLDDRCEAVILLGPRSPPGADCACGQLPVVAVARNRQLQLGRLRPHGRRRSGMNAAVGHLAELGHQRIAYLDGGTHARRPRAPAALKAAAAEHGLGSPGPRSCPPARGGGRAGRHRASADPGSCRPP